MRNPPVRVAHALQPPDTPLHLPFVELTTPALGAAFGQLAAEIGCPRCEAAFETRLAEVLDAWAAKPVKPSLRGTGGTRSLTERFASTV